MLKFNIIFVSISWFSLFCSNPVYSQARTVVKANLLNPIFQTYSLAGEHLFTPSVSLQLGGFYTRLKVKDTRYQGFGFTPELRHYLQPWGVPAGIYLSAFFKHQQIQLENTENNQKARLLTYGLGTLIGGQWLFERFINFALELYGGFSYDFPQYILKGEAEKKNFDVDLLVKINPRFGLTVGWAF